MSSVVKLREVVLSATGSRNPTKSPAEHFVYVDVAAVDNGEKAITGARTVIGAEAPSRARKLIRSGDILVSTVRPNLNAVALVSSELDGQVASTGFCVLRASDKVLPEYLFYFTRSKPFVDGLSSLVAGALYPAVSDSQVLDQTLPVPPLPEQRRIVDLLSRAEGIVRLRREAEKKAAELIPALFLDMFGDPAANPKGWQMKPLQSVAEVGSGNGFPNTYQGKTEGEFPFYKVSDMNTKGNEVEMLGANNYISAEDLNALRAKAFPVGTVIFPKIGAAIATNKKRMLTQPSCFDNNVMGITVGRDLLPTYVHALMVSKNLSDFASDSNPPSIRKTTVEAWEIPVPLISLQSEFANRVETIRSIQNQQSNATAKAQATFDALLAKAFSNNGANV